MVSHDQHNDPALAGAAALAQHAPEYVKAASYEDLYGVSNLPTSVFADAARREFPCHTPAATWLSAGFFSRNEAEIKNAAAVKTRLIDLATFHGVAVDVAKLLTAVPVKEAEAPDEEFAWVDGEGDSKVRKLRLRNTEEIKSAAAFLERHREDIPAAVRSFIATRALLQAEKLGCSDDEACECLSRHACRAVAPAEVLVEELRSRAALAHGKTDTRDKLLKAADNITKDASAGRRSTGVIVQVLEAVDQEQGWTPLYGQLLRRPSDLLAVTEKTANAAANDFVELSTGSIYRTQDLAKLALDQVRDALGEDLAEAVACLDIGARNNQVRVDTTKMATEAHALPRPDAVALENLLAEAGVEPISKAASANDGWLKSKELQQLLLTDA